MRIYIFIASCKHEHKVTQKQLKPAVNLWRGMGTERMGDWWNGESILYYLFILICMLNKCECVTYLQKHFLRNTSQFQISIHLFQEPSICHFKYTLEKTGRKLSCTLSAPMNTESSENFFTEAIFSVQKLKENPQEILSVNVSDLQKISEIHYTENIKCLDCKAFLCNNILTHNLRI